MAKNKAAVELGRRRWKNSTKAERQAHAELLAEARRQKIEPDRRSEIARKAAQARWQKNQ